MPISFYMVHADYGTWYLRVVHNKPVWSSLFELWCASSFNVNHWPTKSLYTYTVIYTVRLGCAVYARHMLKELWVVIL